MNLIIQYSILLLYTLNTLCFGSCVWRDKTDTQSLDLSCLANQRLVDNDTDNGYTYLWSICSNGLSCGESKAMVGQVNMDSGNCFVVGRWNASIKPEYESDADGRWTFEYANGNDCETRPRTWKPTFVCEKDTEYEMTDPQETEPGSCEYTTTVYTKYACTDLQQSCAASSSSGLSDGWIFIIVLCSSFIVYCIVGYFINGFVFNKEGGVKDFKNNIPNKNLWINCIPLVLAGCAVTKDVIVNLTNRNKEGDGDASLIADDDDAGANETAQ